MPDRFDSLLNDFSVKRQRVEAGPLGGLTDEPTITG